MASRFHAAESCNRHPNRITSKLAPNASWPTVEVVYKGPFEQVTDEDGALFRRGEWVVIGWAQAERLCGGPAADQFTFLVS
jgi:hypothetical protein